MECVSVKVLLKKPKNFKVIKMKVILLQFNENGVNFFGKSAKKRVLFIPNYHAHTHTRKQHGFFFVLTFLMHVFCWSPKFCVFSH